MNSKPFTGKYLLPVVGVACFSVALIAWGGQKQTHPQKRTEQNANDTTPKTKTDKKIRDLDDAIDELNNAEIKLNMDKVKAELQDAMKNIDMDKVKMEMDKAMKEVDMEKIKAEVEKATKEIDAAKIEQEVKESLAKVDMEKINDQIKKELEEVKKIDMSKLNDDMKKLQMELKDMQPKIEKEMEKAKVEMEKAKVEMKEYKGFVDGLEKDGLINKKEGYTIQHKSGELIINGKKQPADVYDKYRDFLQKHKNFTIRKSDDDFNIDNDDNGVI
jgi:chromosome segregation ATPase